METLYWHCSPSGQSTGRFCTCCVFVHTVGFFVSFFEDGSQPPTQFFPLYWKSSWASSPRFVLLFYSILLDFTQCKSVCLNISWTIPCFWLVLEHVIPYRLVALTWAQKFRKQKKPSCGNRGNGCRFFVPLDTLIDNFTHLLVCLGQIDFRGRFDMGIPWK